MKAHSFAEEPEGKTKGPKPRIISRFSSRTRKETAKVEHKQESHLHPMNENKRTDLCFQLLVQFPLKETWV